MYLEFQPFTIFLLLATGQGLFLSLALITSKVGNCQANRYLGLFTFLIAITVLDISIDRNDASQGALFLSSLVYPRDFLYGPALYFYIRQMTLPSKYSLLPRQWLHFLPALCHIGIFGSLPFLSPHLYQAIMLDSEMVGSEVSELAENFSSFEVMASVAQIFVYLCLSVRLLNGHRARTHATLSYDEKVNLNWLRRLLYGVIAVYVVWIFEEFFGDRIDLGNTFYDLLGVSLIILIYTMSYLGLRQPVIFSRRAALLVESEDEDIGHIREKYSTSSLSDDLSQKLVDELQQHMCQAQPYLNNQLSLPQLADQIGVSVHYLSQIINEQLGQNFFDFINHYRIKRAQLLLQDTSCTKSNILTIANDAGFNAKSSFYTAFKKHTGMTPGEYRKHIKPNP